MSTEKGANQPPGESLQSQTAYVCILSFLCEDANNNESKMAESRLY